MSLQYSRIALFYMNTLFGKMAKAKKKTLTQYLCKLWNNYKDIQLNSFINIHKLS